VALEDILRMSLWALPHRVTLIRVRNLLQDLRDLLDRERAKMGDREARRQWAVLNELQNGFNPALYRMAREMASEDIVFAEELMALEGRWIGEGRLKTEETVSSQMDWRRSRSA